MFQTKPNLVASSTMFNQHLLPIDCTGRKVEVFVSLLKTFTQYKSLMPLLLYSGQIS